MDSYRLSQNYILNINDLKLKNDRNIYLISNAKTIIPSLSQKTDTLYKKCTKNKKYRTITAIKFIIGHLKTDFRMQQNYH